MSHSEQPGALRVDKTGNDILNCQMAGGARHHNLPAFFPLGALRHGGAGVPPARCSRGYVIGSNGVRRPSRSALSEDKF